MLQRKPLLAAAHGAQEIGQLSDRYLLVQEPLLAVTQTKPLKQLSSRSMLKSATPKSTQS